MRARNVAVLVGSLRKGSFNRKIAHALVRRAPQGMQLRQIEIGALEHYNEDLDDDPPRSWLEFRESIRRSDAVLFVSPEYNRSVPAVLKNAIDVGSRPYGKSVWNGKPAAIMTASPGAIGGFGANHHLRQSLVFLNVPAMQQPEAYIGHVDRLVDDRGEITSAEGKKLLDDFLEAFRSWVELLSGAPK